MTPQPSARAAGSCTQAYARRRRREGQSWRPHSAQCPACLSCDWCNQRPRTGLDYGVVTRSVDGVESGEPHPPFVDGVVSREPPHPHRLGRTSPWAAGQRLPLPLQPPPWTGALRAWAVALARSALSL